MAIDLDSLAEWLAQSKANSERIAEEKEGDDAAGWLDDAAHFSAAIAALKDAKRYQWLRDNPWPSPVKSVIVSHANAVWDSTIDAAMAADAGEW